MPLTRLEIWLKRILFALIVGAFLTSLISTEAVSQGELFLKAVVFQTIVEALFAVWILLALMSPSFRPRWKNPVALAVGFFLFVLVVSLFFSEDPWRSFWSDRRRMTGVVNFLHYGAFFLVLVSTVKTWTLWRRLLWLNLGVGCLVALIGVFEWAAAEGTVRIISTLGNALYLASYLLINLFLALALFVREERRAWRVLALGAAALCFFAIVLTASRGALLAASGGLVLFVLAQALASSWKRSRKIALIVAVGVAALLAAGSLVFLRATHEGQTFTDTSLPFFVERFIYQDFGSDRLTIWSKAWEGFKEKPVFGWGLENFELVFNKTFDPTGSDLALIETWYAKPHNVYAEYLVCGGIVVFLAYILLWLAVFFALIKSCRAGKNASERRLFVVFGILFIVHLIQLAVTMEMPASLLVIFALFAYIAANHESKPEGGKQLVRPFSVAMFVLTVLFGLTAAAGAYYLNILPFSQAWQNQQAFRALYQSSGETPEQALFHLRASLSPETFVTRDLRLRSLDIVAPLLEQFAVRSDTARLMAELVASELATSASAQPSQFRTQLAAAMAHRLAGIFNASYLDRAEDYAKTAAALAPYRSEAYEVMAEIALLRGQYNEALSLFGEALARAQDVRLPIILSRIAAVYAMKGEFDEAFARVKTAEEAGFVPGQDARFVMAFESSVSPGDVPSELFEYYGRLFPLFADHVGVIEFGARFAAYSGKTATSKLLLDQLEDIDPVRAAALRSELTKL